MSKAIVLSIILIFVMIACEETDNDPPVSSITSPTDGAVVSDVLTVRALAVDESGVDIGELYIDYLATGIADSISPFSFVFNTNQYPNDAILSIYVNFTDDNGNSANSDTVMITVNNQESAPNPVELDSIRYENNGFALSWEESPDLDFASYSINRSLSNYMDTSEVIYSTSIKTSTAYLDQNANPFGYYYYRVDVEDQGGLSTQGPIAASPSPLAYIPNELTAEPDTLLPEIHLFWVDNCDFEDGFIIERGDGSTFTEIDQVGAGIQSYTDRGLGLESEYWYRVAAFTQGGTSGFSNVVSIISPITFSPSELVATPYNEEISLSWVDNTELEQGFIIERDEGSGFTQISTVEQDVTSYSDVGLMYGIEYSYRVAAYFDTLVSDYTNIVSERINYFTLEWIEIAPGNFTFGESDVSTELDYTYDIMQYEVTNRQYVTYLEEALARGDIDVTFTEVSSVGGADLYYDLLDSESKISWTGSIFIIQTGYENYPVSVVSWLGAGDFAEFYGWRLPNEHEWEKAARGNTGWDYPWGDSPPTCELANYSGCNDGIIPVGITSGESPYGVSDMVGNVWEWTSDLHEGGPNRAVRGGSWSYYTEDLQVWNSMAVDPEYTYYLIGFRCVRD